ncbi:hypothetical protein BpHYR1_005489 [Brachionus plicatilis]|uniref:Uncharacterized protein n=1 Tax=Brachionus plicatilis TaxID=10195 RepID=A0A3M7PF77_BRAPC|nr:hypothetical protein BpHYR1_005489 [Brachionus plicatilis]
MPEKKLFIAVMEKSISNALLLFEQSSLARLCVGYETCLLLLLLRILTILITRSVDDDACYTLIPRPTPKHSST